MGQTQLLFIFISFKSLIKTLLTAIEINFNFFENELKSWRGPVTSPISFVRILTINKWVFLSHPFSLSFSHSLGHSLKLSPSHRCIRFAGFTLAKDYFVNAAWNTQLHARLLMQASELYYNLGARSNSFSSSRLPTYIFIHPLQHNLASYMQQT